MKPYIIETRGFRIVRDTHYHGRQCWAAKRGAWVGGGVGNWRSRSVFRTRKAAELELKRIELSLTPDVSKKKVAQA